MASREVLDVLSDFGQVARSDLFQWVRKSHGVWAVDWELTMPINSYNIFAEVSVTANPTQCW